VRDFRRLSGFPPDVRRLAGLLSLLALLVLAPAAGAAGTEATRRVLSAAMAQAGPATGAQVVDLDTGARLFAARATLRLAPASVEKLYTSSTALLRMGPNGRIETGVLTRGLPDATGRLRGDLILKGGGDPTLGPWAMDQLARTIAQAGLTRVTGRVIGDETAFDARRGPPSSGYTTSIYVGPLSALSFNEGRTGLRSPAFQLSPPQFAADALTRALEHRGVAVRGAARRGVAPAGAVPLLSWESPPLATVLRLMNLPSDNFYAETLVKQLGARYGGAGTTAAGAAVVRATVARFGARPQVVDGSGLSRADRTAPRDVVRLLAGMHADPVAGPALADSLPVAGRSGTLVTRMRGTAATGRCRAKTGTLSDVSALAGYCDTTAGRHVAFAFLMNGVNPTAARRLQDRMTAALATLR
jgi:serine-type D-Ala-D-Ala carboxypeptidase/endopeptidase (penicillin-binding protein 4)